MTESRNELKKKIVLDALATQSPIGLALVDDNVYEVPRHIELLNKALMDVASGKIKRLAVFMPPRHGKSELCSKYFPSWYLGTHPDDRIILCSAEADFAATWGQKVRDIFKEHNAIYGVNVNDRSAARNRWDIAGHRGGMDTAGVGGQITGKGAEILIIDDPVKNAEQANSPTYREKAKDWYRSTAFTRLTPSGKVILIQTRWHEDDLGGWLLGEDDDWTVISLPGLADSEDDALGREIGEPLWPELWTVDKLLQSKKTLGEYWFSAMYQQQPQPPEGGMLKRKWIQYYDPNDPAIRTKLDAATYYLGSDLAISEKEEADYTTTCVIAAFQDELYIVDWTRDHLTVMEQVEQINKQNQRYNIVMNGIETVAYQAALVQLLRPYRLPIRQLPRTGTGDKVTRITSAWARTFEQARVYIPEGHPLMGEFENEYVHFPRGKHDDLLDATEVALTLADKGANPFTESKQYYVGSIGSKRRDGRPKAVRL